MIQTTFINKVENFFGSTKERSKDKVKKMRPERDDFYDSKRKKNKIDKQRYREAKRSYS